MMSHSGLSIVDVTFFTPERSVSLSLLPPAVEGAKGHEAHPMTRTPLQIIVIRPR